MDWDDSFFEIIEHVVKKSIPYDQDLAQEALSFVLEEIWKDNQKRLLNHREGISANNLVSMVTLRTLRDFWVHKKGRIRYPRRLLEGSNFLTLLVYKRLCWQKQPVKFIIEQLTDAGNAPEEVETAIWEIREKYTDCEAPKVREISEGDLPESTPGLDNAPLKQRPASNNCSPSEMLLAKDLRYFFNYILRGVPEQIPEDRIISAKTRSEMQQLRKKFKATDQECKFMRLIHLSGIGTLAAGKLFGWKKNVAYGKKRRLWKKFNKLLKKRWILEEFCAPN